MKITRLEGIKSNLLLCNSTQIFKATGSNQNIGTYAYASVNDVQVPSITSANGLYVIVFDEYLNRLETRRFNLLASSPSGRRDIDFINYMGTLPPRRYYMMVTNGVIGHTNQLDVFFSEFLKTSMWGTMWNTYESIFGSVQSAPVSFSCIGNTELGITHQSYALHQEASVTANISEYDKFAVTGYGLPLYEIENQQFNSTFSNHLITDLGGAKALCCSFRYNNAVNNNDIFIRKIYQDNSTADVVIPTNIGKLNKSVQYHINLEDNVKWVRVYCRNVKIYYASISKANSGTISNNPVSSISKRGKGVSVRDTRFSMNGYDFENSTHLANFSSNSNVEATLPNTEIIDGVSMRSFNYNGTYMSDFIEVDHASDYYFGMFVKRTVNTNAPTFVRLYAYDDSYNPVDTISLLTQSSNTNIDLGDFTLDSNDVAYQEYYLLSSKQTVNNIDNASFLLNGVHGSLSTGGLSANINNVNDIAIMTPQVKYIKIELSSSISNEYISPNFDKIRFSLTKDSRYLGNITEN